MGRTAAGSVCARRCSAGAVGRRAPAGRRREAAGGSTAAGAGERQDLSWVKSYLFLTAGCAGRLLLLRDRELRGEGGDLGLDCAGGEEG